MASMSREEFLTVLENRLKRLPKEERVEAVSYYSEYLEEGSVEELGNPDVIARQIIDQCAIKSLDSKEKGSSLKTLWIVLLAVFAAPVAIPVAVAVGAVVLALMLTAGAVVISVAVCGAAFIAIGIYTAVIGIAILSAVNFINMLMVVGIGLILIGGGLLILIGIYYAAKLLIRQLARLLGKMVKRGDRNE